MALSQFVEPYSAEQVQSFIKKAEDRGKKLAQWELDAYNFKPLMPNELLRLSEDEVAAARYVRAACVRINTSSLTQRSIDRGRLSTLDFEFIFKTVLSEEKMETYQKRLLGSEQVISVVEATKFIKLICDVERPVEELASKNIHYAANYYLKQFRKLPRINSAKDLPKLQEISFIKDSFGTVIGNYSNTETIKIDGVTLISKRNRRKLPSGPIPPMIKKALVSIEDRRFFEHSGVDLIGIIRAFEAMGSNEVQGASTLTMQLAKNLLLYEDVFKEHHFGKRSLVRKLNEYILVKRLEKALSKDEILDWYLNTIYFGRRSEGIVMAARSYFDKELEALNLEEIAFLVGLPKAPNSLDPQQNYDKALFRRNTVINQMGREQLISTNEKEDLKKKPINFVVQKGSTQKEAYAHFYTSAVEKQLKDWLRSINQNPNLGFDITVPINHDYQKWAVESLQKGLLKFERWRGDREEFPDKKRRLTVKPSKDRLPNIEKDVEALAFERGVSTLDVFPEVLRKVSPGYVDAGQFKIGVILSNTKMGLADGSQVNRQPYDRNGRLYKEVDGKKENLKIWDTVLLQEFSKKNGGVYYRIASYTKVQGGIVVLDNKTGAVLATSGGFSIGAGQIFKGEAGQNAFSAERQPGSTVKPFVYLYALSKGVSTSETISNTNVTFPSKNFDGERVCNKKTWTGDSREASSYLLRNGLIKSKNRTTLNTFAKALGLTQRDNYVDNKEVLGSGIDELLTVMQRFGLYTERDYLCYQGLLGGRETTVVEMAGAYGALANGGTYNRPFTINQIARRGQTASPFELESSVDKTVKKAIQSASIERGVNYISKIRPLLQGVMGRGTAKSILRWSDVIGGKTGTTNSNKDTWFVGFNKEITVAVWVGYPEGETLGEGSEGGTVALPVFEYFMEEYYKKFPDKLSDKFQSVTASIEPNTGYRLSSDFQSDYERFTGRGNKLSSTLEYYSSEDEKREQSKSYYQGSRVAGNFFFDNLAKDLRAWYRQEYNKAYSNTGSVIVRSQHSRSLYEEAKAYCDKWKKTHPRRTHSQVDDACSIKEQYEQDVKNARANQNLNKPSFRQYFLNRIDFNK